MGVLSSEDKNRLFNGSTSFSMFMLGALFFGENFLEYNSDLQRLLESRI